MKQSHESTVRCGCQRKRAPSTVYSLHALQVDQLQAQLSTHAEQHEIKARELTTIKRHAGTVLNQRSEVEQFLLESIQQVKAEIRARRDDKLKCVLPRARDRIR